MLEESNIRHQLTKLKPDEIYNLAAQSFVGVSFEQPLYTSTSMRSACCVCWKPCGEACPDARFYQASTSEMFGKAQETPQNEKTPFYPRSPYAVAKLFAHWSVVNYREAHGLYACSGILSITRALWAVASSSPARSLSGSPAWPSATTRCCMSAISRPSASGGRVAGEYVEGMGVILQQGKPGDYVLATGRTTTVRDFIKRRRWLWLRHRMDGQRHRCSCRSTGGAGARIIAVDPKFYRPTEVDLLVGDCAQGKAELGWEAKTSLEDLIQMMVKADYDRVKTGLIRC